MKIISKLLLYINTIKYLKFSQLFFRIFYTIRNNIGIGRYDKTVTYNELHICKFNLYLYNFNSLSSKNSFTFLNKTNNFEFEIDWNYKVKGKLWAYNLNYFDFLNQKEISVNDGKYLINSFISKLTYQSIGLESYPTSLRLINWVKFNSRFNREISIEEINSFYSQGNYLSNNLEKHILGNHLLENGFGLLFVSYSFRDEKFYNKAYHIITTELAEQILEDGLHFELSIMYHQIILHRVLDSINLINNNKWKQDDLISTLYFYASKMMKALNNTTFSNGDIPHVNDSSNSIAPSTISLLKYSHKLNINHALYNTLNDSGYRMIRKDSYELFIDIGKIGPKYIPGHAHADTFNFIFYYKNNPIIVDVGTSTYEKHTNIRQIERGTSSHNTISILDKNSSQVWGGFRVGNRANIINIKESKKTISATHNGYGEVLHTREWYYESNSLIITDVLNKKDVKAKAYFHLFHDLNPVIIGDRILLTNNIEFKFGKNSSIEVQTYNLALEFNNTIKSKQIIVEFVGKLITEIKMSH